jgi:transcription initiation factor TFIIB
MSSQCPECKSTKIVKDYDTKEITCEECGYVLGHEMDMGPEWRAFTKKQRLERTRVGAPTTNTVHDKGLSTVIDWRNRDSYGRSIGPKKSSQYRRLRKWQKRCRVSDAIERNLAYALGLIDAAKDKLTMTTAAHQEASIIYRKALKQKLTRGRSIASVAAASTKLSLRQHGIVKNYEEIAKAFNAPEKEVRRYYRLLLKELNYTVAPPDVTSYVANFSNKLKLKGETEGQSHEIIKAARKYKPKNKDENSLVKGRDPKSIAAAAVYIASLIMNERKTQREISEAARVTEVTIRNRYKELEEKLFFDFYV